MREPAAPRDLRRVPLRIRLWIALPMLACAPSQSFRPPSVSGDAVEHELGLAVSSLGARPYVNESSRALAQAWWSERIAERWSVSGILAFDASAGLGGAALRWDALRTSTWALSSELELGLFWAAVSLPAALSVWDGGRLYTAPRFGNWGPDLTFFAPLGLDAELSDHLSLRGELQLSWAELAAYNRRLHAGIGIAYHWR